MVMSPRCVVRADASVQTELDLQILYQSGQSLSPSPLMPANPRETVFEPRTSPHQAWHTFADEDATQQGAVAEYMQPQSVMYASSSHTHDPGMYFSIPNAHAPVPGHPKQSSGGPDNASGHPKSPNRSPGGSNQQQQQQQQHSPGVHNQGRECSPFGVAVDERPGALRGSPLPSSSSSSSNLTAGGLHGHDPGLVKDSLLVGIHRPRPGNTATYATRPQVSGSLMMPTGEHSPVAAPTPDEDWDVPTVGDGDGAGMRRETSDLISAGAEPLEQDENSEEPHSHNSDGPLSGASSTWVGGGEHMLSTAVMLARSLLARAEELISPQASPATTVGARNGGDHSEDGDMELRTLSAGAHAHADDFECADGAFTRGEHADTKYSCGSEIHSTHANDGLYGTSFSVDHCGGLAPPGSPGSMTLEETATLEQIPEVSASLTSGQMWHVRTGKTGLVCGDMEALHQGNVSFGDACTHSHQETGLSDVERERLSTWLACCENASTRPAELSNDGNARCGNTSASRATDMSLVTAWLPSSPLLQTAQLRPPHAVDATSESRETPNRREIRAQSQADDDDVHSAPRTATNQTSASLLTAKSQLNATAKSQLNATVSKMCLPVNEHAECFNCTVIMNKVCATLCHDRKHCACCLAHSTHAHTFMLVLCTYIHTYIHTYMHTCIAYSNASCEAHQAVELHYTVCTCVLS
jgi:hypothetical protein